MPKMSKKTIKLVSLRHVKGSYDGLHISKGVSKMRMLRELSFEVSNEIDETIKELKNLNNLEKLSLFHLDRVVSNEDVMECNLMGKHRLQELRLSWDSYDGGSSSKNVSEYDVFEGLQPPENLRDLEIDNYSGIRSPNWMKNLSLLNLQMIVISKCRCWNMADVSFGHLQNLMYLEIMEMSGVQQLGPKFFGDGDVRGFPSLEYLDFSKMENWEEWRMPSDNLPNTQIFPRLKELVIYSCPKLKNIPFQILSNLRELTITNCPMLSVGLTELVSLDLSHLSNLRELTIGNCPKLLVGSMAVVSSQLKKFIIGGVTLCQLKEWLMVLSSNTTTTTSSELKELTIRDCPELMYFDADMDEALDKLTNLSELYIWDCPNLVSLPENGLPSSLQTLRISKCDNLKSLPENGLPSSLQTLRISECDNLKSLPENGLPSSLQTLRIINCGKVLKERCQEGGADWHNIEHIPDKFVD